ncbi:nitric oxide dioxygenase [Apiospora hydei]|uniref:nitric oxide dioxygenase n=1 Tax=Apiospora hydei TaxID=1337664 RepID=A0ABR1W8U0_9PEZI
MALSYQQAKLVKGTVPILKEHGEHIATVFYKTMLKDHPELNDYFNSVHMRSGMQPRALTSLILSFAANVSHLSELGTKLERVANKHVSLGIQPDQYEIVGKYLIRALAAVLGAAMTEEVRVAWTKAYWIMANMLMSREVQLYKSFGTWTGWRKFYISGKIPETPDNDMISFRLKPLDGSPLPDFLPGQYVSIQLRVPGSGYLQSRQYSLSDAPRSDSFRITVKRLLARDDACAYCDAESPAGSLNSGISGHSRASTFSTAVASTAKGHYFGSGQDHCSRPQGIVSNLMLDQMQVGDVLELTHPVGEFHLNTDPEHGSMPLVLISAGNGVTPLLSMLNTISEKHLERPVSWIQGSQNAIPFEEHVKKLAKSNPRLKTTFFNTGFGMQDLAESSDSNGFGYYLEWLKPEDMYFDNKSTEYYICGPRRFMLDMASYLSTNGVMPSQVRHELHATGFFELDPPMEANRRKET